MSHFVKRSTLEADNLLQHPCKYKEHSLKGFPPSIFVTINHLKPNKTYFRSLTRKLFHKPLKDINLFMILVACHLESDVKALPNSRGVKKDLIIID